MGDARRISKTGKSKKLGKMKKKKQVVAADLSSDREEEKQGEDAEVEVYQMSSADEDKGVKNETLETKKKSKKWRDEKRKKAEMNRGETQEFDTQSEQTEDKLQKSKKKKRQNVENIKKVDDFNEKDDETLEITGGKKKSKRSRDEKRKKGEMNRRETQEFDTQSEHIEDKLQKPKKKKRKNVEKIDKVDEFNEKDDASEQQIGKSKKDGKKKKKQLVATDISSKNLVEKIGEEKQGGDAEDEVYEMSSGEEDYSKGMKKWITEYHQSRPGLKVLQERIDDFIVAHEAKEEQAKAEREAKAAEGGWTVVVHHRGRKKTTDAESGVAVGSVAQAAVLDNMGKKKKKEVGLDFYRFQKKEAHRNEIMMLQSKFEQDKKRIQQMRAARKFRPY